MKDRIYKIMQKEGLTNAEFADKLGISNSSLSHIFSGYQFLYNFFKRRKRIRLSFFMF